MKSIDLRVNEARKLEAYASDIEDLLVCNRGQNENKITDTDKNVGSCYEIHSNNWQPTNSNVKARLKVAQFPTQYFFLFTIDSSDYLDIKCGRSIKIFHKRRNS